MDKTENAVAIVERLLSLGEELEDACKVAGIPVKRYEKFRADEALRAAGTALQQLRASLSMEAPEFAKSLGISASVLASIEAGKKQAPEKVLAKLRETYGTDLAEAAARVQKRGGAPEAPAAAKRNASSRKTSIVIQSPMGGSITADEILERIGDVDAVYIRVDENKAYWVRGFDTGSIDLWK